MAELCYIGSYKNVDRRRILSIARVKPVSENYKSIYEFNKKQETNFTNIISNNNNDNRMCVCLI